MIVTQGQVDEAWRLRKRGYTWKQVSEMTGVQITTIWRSCTFGISKHMGRPRIPENPKFIKIMKEAIRLHEREEILWKDIAKSMNMSICALRKWRKAYARLIKEGETA